MAEINVLYNIRMEKYEGETDGQAMERLARIMDSELCHLADHVISCRPVTENTAEKGN